ncbi:TonB-dependent receptor domain-containing protein [Dyella flava]|uniref:TonB-dependent receptor domain-containing protein n=1 Tax=Dyella flava TaxID=1920170 RepID=UPI001EF95CB9|nr:TonB-dependent receptor [Dyella flava]GLQ50840.1 TonB-dependent receptor [Dyella flava]
MSLKKTALAAALLSLGLAAPASYAQTASDQSGTTPNSTLEPVIVTATRTAITENDALASVTVITREDIERLQPTSIADLLTGLPGVSIAQTGGIGAQTSLYLRGTNADHVLVMIDGVRIGSVSSGLAALEQIPVDAIDRIELVRGPRATLYGSDAIGGVIQIFLRHGQPNGGVSPSLSVTGGSHGYVKGQAGVSGGDSHLWYNASLGGEYTGGIPGCRMGAAELGVACFVDDPNNDAYRNWNGFANFGYRWDNGTELAFDWLRSKSDAEYAGSPYSGNDAIEEQYVYGARLSFSPLDLWKVTLSAGQSRDDDATYYQGTYYGEYYPRMPTGFFDSRRNQASWQNDITLATNQLLTVGVDYDQEHIYSDTGFEQTTRGDTGTFAQYQGTFGQNEIQLSARHDHNDQFGNHNTGAAAWGYHFDQGPVLSVSYGSAFHAPTFDDLYFPAFGGVPTSNPDLKPETSHSAEIGLTQQLSNWNWGVNAYQTRITDLIELNSLYIPMNIDSARIRGVEGQFGFTLDGWKAQTYLTWLQPKDDGGLYNGNILPRRAERTAREDVDRTFGKFNVGATFFASGKRYDDAANVYRLGGYATTDFRAGYTFAPGWQVEAKLANAFNHSYETAYYYNQLGRTWYLTLRYSPATIQ